jgi:hypothetical protein
LKREVVENLLLIRQGSVRQREQHDRCKRSKQTTHEIPSDLATLQVKKRPIPVSRLHGRGSS